MSKKEIYISVDVEADGPIPAVNSMLSFGAVAFDSEGNELSCFARNLETLPGATGAPDTMTWWATQPEAWAAARKDPVDPSDAMKAFVEWVEGLDGKPVFIGYPVAYDFMFIHWYLHRFVGRSPFSHSALDIKTLAMIAMKGDYRASTKRNMPKNWHSKIEHNHVGLDDARGQGHLFFNIMKVLRA